MDENDSAVVLGNNISCLSRDETVSVLERFGKSGKPHQVVTVNSEFLLAAQSDDGFKAILNNSSLNTADGIGVLWAAKFLSLPLAKFPAVRFFQIIWQFKYSLLAVIFAPRWIRTVIREKNSGTDLIWEVARIAQKNDLSVYLLGGYDDTPDRAGERLRARFPGLRIAGSYAGTPDEPGLLEKIRSVHPDILLVAFGPVRQEKWIDKNLRNLPVSLAIGLGGTFDYLAGKRPLAPNFLRYIGLEWAFRLITQPYRIFRVINAILVFPWYVLRYKFQIQKPYRKDVVGFIINSKDQILACRASSKKDDFKITPYYERWQLPQGGVEDGEDDGRAFAREMKEEIGLEKFTELGRIEDYNKYDWPIKISSGLYQGRFRGQSQTAFLARMDESVNPIKLDNLEFDNYQWMDKNNLIEKLHPIYGKSVKKIVENFDRFIKPNIKQ